MASRVSAKPDQGKSIDRHTVFAPFFGKPPEKIVGREEEIDYLERSLRTPLGDPHRAVLITGQRGMGKTVLLQEAHDRGVNDGFIVAKVTNSSDMLAEIIEILRDEIERNIRRRHRASVDVRRHLTGLGFTIMGNGINVEIADEEQRSVTFRGALSRLCVKADDLGMGVLLLVDEVRSDSEPLSLLGKTFQELVGESKNIAIMMAGLPSAISRLLNVSTLTFLARAERLKIATISLRSVERYYRATFKKLGYALTLGQIKQLASATRGFPFLLQLVGYEFVNAFEPNDDISDDEIAYVVDAAIDELAEKTFEPALAPLTAVDREMLKIVAEVADDDVALVSDVVDRINPKDHTKGNSRFSPHRKRLIEHGVLDVPRRGVLEFTIPYLAEYLRA